MWTSTKIRPLFRAPRAIPVIPSPHCRAHSPYLARSQRRTLSSKPSDSAAATPAKPSAHAQLKLKLKPKFVNALGPDWIWTYTHRLAYPLRVYGRAQSKRPYATQVASSIVIYFCGDLLSQFIEHSSKTNSTAATAIAEQSGSPVAPPADGAKSEGSEAQYSPERSVRAIIIGSVFSIPSYHWFLFLSHNFNVPSTVAHSHLWSLVVKIFINQVFFTPFFNSYFFGMQSLLSSAPTKTQAGDPIHSHLSARYAQAKAELVWDRLRETVPISWYNSCKFWPFVTAFSFSFIRPQSRSAFAGVVAVGWQSYLGIVNQRAIKKAQQENSQIKGS